MDFLHIFKFILWFVGGIVNVPYEFVIKTIPFATKPFGYLTETTTPEDEADEDHHNESTEMVITEKPEPVQSDLCLYVPMPECKIDLMDWCLIVMGILAMILWFVRLFKSSRKDNRKSEVIRQQEDDVLLNVQPNEDDVSNGLKSNDNEEFLKLKYGNNDLEADEPSKEQEFNYLALTEQERLLYLEAAAVRILNLPPDEERFRKPNENEEFLDLEYDDNDLPGDDTDLPPHEERFPQYASNSEQERAIAMAYEKNGFSDEIDRFPTSESEDFSEEDYPPIVIERAQENVWHTKKSRLISKKDFPTVSFSQRIRARAYANVTSSDDEQVLPHKRFKGKHNRLTGLYDRMQEYNAKKKFNISPSYKKATYSTKFVRTSEMSAQSMNFPNLTSNMGLPSLKECLFTDVPSGDKRSPDLFSDDKDLDLPSGKKNSSLPFGSEKKVLPEKTPVEKPNPLSELFELKRMCNVKKLNVEPHKLTSNVEDVSTSPSDKKLPDSEGLDLPSAVREFSYADYKPEDLPPLPPDDGEW